MPDLGDAVARFERALSDMDGDAAVGLVERLLDSGVDPVGVLVDVIALAQRAVGQRWQRGEWSVAQEHAATAISVSATEAVGRHARTIPADRGRVVVACAEHEWHALPSMIIGYALRANGWHLTLLGASTSPLRLSQYLQDLGPDVTAISTSMLGALPTTRRFIEASTAAGIPVMVGGPAFGTDARRADALGANAWALTARDAVVTAATLPAVVPKAPPLPAEPAAEQAAIGLTHEELTGSLRHRWTVAEGLGDVVDDSINLAVHAVSAALLTGDERVVPDTATWIRELVAARGGEPMLVDELGALLAGVFADYPLAHTLIERHWPLAARPAGTGGQ